MNELETQQKGIALIYLRVSTGKQAEKGIALPTQQDTCFTYANREGYVFNEVTDVYVERGETGRNMDRPKLIEMLQRCDTDKTVKAVIVYDVSRLARDRIDFAIIKRDFKKRGIKLLSATEGIDDTPEGQMLEGMLSTIAEFFSLQHGRRVKANLLQKVKSGGWSGAAPYGYKNVQERASTGKTKAWLEVNWEEAKWVARAFELYATGKYSTAVLTKQLMEEGWAIRKRAKSSGVLHKSHLERLLQDRFYIGIVEWHGEVANEQANHELFLDRALFDKVQTLLKARAASGSSRQRRLFSVLKGISFCGECGSKMTSEEQIKKDGKCFRYLRCLKMQKKQKMDCKQGYTHESEYESQFAKLLKTIQLPPGMGEKLRLKVKALFSEEQTLYEKARKSIQDQIEGIKRKKKNLVLQLVDKERNSEGDMDVYHAVMADLVVDEVRLTDELGKVESKLGGVVRTVEIALSLTVNCSYAFEKAKEPQLRALLANTLFKKLYFRDGVLIRAVLQEPLDYLCRDRISGNPVFEQDAYGGPSRIRTCEGISQLISIFLKFPLRIGLYLRRYPSVIVGVSVSSLYGALRLCGVPTVLPCLPQ